MLVLLGVETFDEKVLKEITNNTNVLVAIVYTKIKDSNILLLKTFPNDSTQIKMLIDEIDKKLNITAVYEHNDVALFEENEDKIVYTLFLNSKQFASNLFFKMLRAHAGNFKLSWNNIAIYYRFPKTEYMAKITFPKQNLEFC